MDVDGDVRPEDIMSLETVTLDHFARGLCAAINERLYEELGACGGTATVKTHTRPRPHIEIHIKSGEQELFYLHPWTRDLPQADAEAMLGTLVPEVLGQAGRVIAN